MSSINLTPNMNLPVPGVDLEPGPQWATDINNCMSILDSHSHVPGSGVAITPAAMNINADLPMGNNNLLTVKSVRFTSQGTPLVGAADLGCLYESGVDLYYNDGAGNQIRITQSGGVAGTPGSISNLLPPASASYVSGSTKFVWQSDTNVSADMDFGSAILRNATANSKGLTLAPPNAMGADYTVTLPALPGQTNILTMTSSGAIAAVLNVDNVGIEISSNLLQLKDGGVTTAKLADGAVTRAKIAAIGQQSSASCTDNHAAGSYRDITGMSFTITTTGHPVQILVMPDATSQSYISYVGAGSGYWQLLRDAVVVGVCLMTNTSIDCPPGCLNMIDIVGAGTYFYRWQFKTSGSGTVGVTAVKTIGYELG